MISVVISTFNPKIKTLQKTISGLKNQTLKLENWELIIIDNNSTHPVEVDLSWHPNSKIVKEPKPGLTYGRLKGFSLAKGEIIVMVDDDNILNQDYLNNCLIIFNNNQKLGAIGGKSIPLFESKPPPWLKDFYTNLALRDLGENEIIETWKMEYPEISPIGAGMGIRRIALDKYLQKIATEVNITTDRIGSSLTSGGDNDIILEVLKDGWQVGYFPQLSLKHIIPQQRMTSSYISKLVNNTNKSWVLLLESHGINPWNKIPKWTLSLRKLKSFVAYQAWKNKTNYINWQGACGLFGGLASIKNAEKA
ncbi:glycosyltransferase involved in cell wall biosynthesis [Pedobacter sp. UYP30]|uniref:glycosyltransferase n=1 Tax=Pedobacter sp. UYP30 TaxID=1756400 RepID=UPI0033989F77